MDAVDLLIKAFRAMLDEWKAEGEESGLMMIKQTEYYVDAGTHFKIFEEHPDVSARGDVDHLPDIHSSASRNHPWPTIPSPSPR